MAYTKTTWQDLPNTTTPINATRLNNIENGIKENDDKLLGNKAMGNIVVDSVKSKNLLNLSGIGQTKNGVTISYDNDTGIITLNGTATAQTDFDFSYLVGFTLKKSVDYVSSSTYVSGTTSNNCSFYMQDSNHSWRGPSITISQNNYTEHLKFTDADTVATLALLRVPSGTVTSNFKFKLMIEENGSFTNFAPFQNLNGYDYYYKGQANIGKWVNGKPLYRKVVEVGYLPNNTTKTLDIGLSNVQFVTNIYGCACSSGISLPLPYVSVGGLNTCIAIWLSNNYNTLNIQTGYDRSALYSFIIIEYTKSTD